MARSMTRSETGLIVVVASVVFGLGGLLSGCGKSEAPAGKGQPPPVQQQALQQVQPQAQPAAQAQAPVQATTEPPAQPDTPAAAQAPPAPVVEHKEIAPNKVRGKIIDTGWKLYVVRSRDTGKKYSFAVGRVTEYSSRKRLREGDEITVRYEHERGRLVALHIQIH